MNQQDAGTSGEAGRDGGAVWEGWLSPWILLSRSNPEFERPAFSRFLGIRHLSKRPLFS